MKTVKKTRAERACDIVRDLLDVGVSLYMAALIVILPLYSTESGYRSIGTDKSMFFRSVSLTACKVILPLTALYLVLLAVRQWRLAPGRFSGIRTGGRDGSMRARGRTDGTRTRSRAEKHGAGERLPSVTDLFALLYLAAVICSYLHTPFKQETEWGDTFYGTYSWYLGLLTQLLFLGIYFAVSRLWQRRDWMAALWLPTAAAVALLGYLNRFGVRPLEMQGAGPQFISTIGNINWYCGYIVTVTSAIAYYIWRGRAGMEKKWLRALAVASLGICLATLVTQGSSSGIVALFLLLGVFYLLSMGDGERLQRFFEGCILLSGVCICTWLVRMTWPQAMDYAESTTDLLTLSPFPFLLLGVSLICRYLVCRGRRTGDFKPRIWVVMGATAWAAAGVAAIAYVALLALNTAHPGSIGELSGLGAFTFDDAWGSNRGITWTVGLTCFLKQDLAGKLVGVGPDAMALYIHSGVDPALKQTVEDYFGRLSLTNAHNEWLTVLINEGLLGAAGYIGLTVTAVFRYLKAGREDALAGAAGMGILAYTLNNIFSFQQIMSTSVVFLLLGIGEACLRMQEK